MKKRVFASLVSQVLIFFIFLTPSHAQGFAPTEEQNQNALELAQEWMALVDAEEYDAAYALFSEDFKEEVSVFSWERTIKLLRDETGDVVSRSIEQMSWHPNVNGVPGALGVTVVSFGRFEKGDRYRLVISMIAEGENELRVQRTESDFASYETIKGIKAIQISTMGRRFLNAEVSEEEWQTYLTEILTLSSWRSYINDDQIVIDSAEPSTIYVFTAPDHFAHPAVIRREVKEKDGAVLIDMIGYFAGEQSEFDKWWQQFNELNQRVMERANSE